MKFRNLILASIILTMIVLSGCSKENTAKSKPAMSNLTATLGSDDGTLNPAFDLAPLIKKANDRWPYPEELKTYQKALDLHRNGKSAEAIKLIRTIVDKEIKLLPDDTELSPETFFSIYTGGRMMPASKLLRDVFSANQDYADSLAKSSDTKSSIGIYALNACLGRQIIHMKPTEYIILGTGNFLWLRSWNSISAGFNAAGDKRKAKEASGFSRTAEKFKNVRIHAASDISDPLSISGQNELKHTVELWDEDVDTEPARNLLNQLMAD